MCERFDSTGSGEPQGSRAMAVALCALDIQMLLPVLMVMPVCVLYRSVYSVDDVYVSHRQSDTIAHTRYCKGHHSEESRHISSY